MVVSFKQTVGGWACGISGNECRSVGFISVLLGRALSPPWAWFSLQQRPWAHLLHQWPQEELTMAYVIHSLGSTLSCLSKSSLVHSLCLLTYCYMLLGYLTPNKQTELIPSMLVFGHGKVILKFSAWLVSKLRQPVIASLPWEPGKPGFNSRTHLGRRKLSKSLDLYMCAIACSSLHVCRHHDK